jgi:hypothetical protein
MKSRLEGINLNGGQLDELGSWGQTMDLLTSPDFADWMIKNDGLLPAGAAEKLDQVYTVQYENKVIPIIQEEYNRKAIEILDPGKPRPGANLTSVPMIKPVEEFIIPKIMPSGSVKFILRGENLAGANKRRAEDIVQELNHGNGETPSVAGEINRLIKSRAHIEAHKNYKSVWETLLEGGLFGGADLTEDGEEE